MLLKLPQNITSILDMLMEKDFECYAVGGCVRDLLMNRQPDDYDITTNALPIEVKKIFPHTADTGLQHGTVTVIQSGEPIEVTTYRTEGEYTDSRRPDKVEFISDINGDLDRRDFTVNAIAYNPRLGLVDPYHGRADIENRILRAVGDPKKRFCEDALRILRLFRFAAKLGFRIEDATLSAALTLSDGLKRVSYERIATELLKTACADYPERSEPLINSKALDFIGIYSAFELKKISELPQKSELRIFAFLSLCECDVISTLKQLKFSNHITGYCKKLLSLDKISPHDKVEIKKALRDFGQECLCDHFIYRQVIRGENTTSILEMTENILQNAEPYLLKHLAVSSEELKSEGFTGKNLGQALELLLELVIQDPSLNCRETLINISHQINRN